MGFSSSKQKLLGVVLAAILCAAPLSAPSVSAVEGRAGLAEYFKNVEENGHYVSAEINALLGGQQPLAVQEFGDLIITVTEVVADTEQFYVSVVVELKPGLSGIVLESPYWPADEEGFFRFPRNETMDSVYYVVVDGLADTGTRWHNIDGSLSCVMHGDFWCDFYEESPLVLSEGMPLSVWVLKDPPTVTDGPLDWAETHFTYVAPVVADIESVQMTGEVRDKNILIESLELRRTPITTYCKAVFSFSGDEGSWEQAARLGFHFQCTGDVADPFSVFENHFVFWLHGDRYAVMTEWDIPTLPDAVTVRVIDKKTSEVLGQATNIPLQ